MNPIKNLWQAAGNLANALNGAAALVSEATDNARRNLGMDPAAGNELAFQELKSSRDSIDQFVRNLNDGDKKGMAGYKDQPSVKSELDRLNKAWASLQTNATKIVDNQPLVLGAATSAKDFTERIGPLASAEILRAVALSPKWPAHERFRARARYVTRSISAPKAVRFCTNFG